MLKGFKTFLLRGNVLTVNGSKFLVGDFINAVLAFGLVAAVRCAFCTQPLTTLAGGPPLQTLAGVRSTR